VGDFEPQVTFTHDFVVRYPREDVWAFFERTSEVAACLPGASITGGDDRSVTGRLRIRVGPIAAEFEGIAVVERNASTYSGTILGSGRDTRSSSATRGSINYRVVPGDDTRTTRVEIIVGYAVTGALAQFSRTTLMQDIAKRITRTFVQNLEARLAAPGTAAPRLDAELNAGALVLSAMAERIRGWFRRLIGR
jgi:carbon-monoxide dehydrogenase small subunit